MAFACVYLSMDALALRMIALAMREQDTFAVSITYTDASGVRTRRVVSPIRFEQGTDRFKALCLAREDVRTFTLSKCSDVRLVHACDVVMPVEIERLL